jgi:hypothetical protein
LEHDRWYLANICCRARDSKGNLMVMPKPHAPYLNPKEEWFDARRKLGIPEWQIQETWDEYERAAQRTQMNGRHTRTS